MEIPVGKPWFQEWTDFPKSMLHKKRVEEQERYYEELERRRQEESETDIPMAPTTKLFMIQLSPENYVSLTQWRIWR